MRALIRTPKRALALGVLFFAFGTVPCLTIASTAAAQDELECDMTLRGEITAQSIDLIINKIKQLRERGNQLNVIFCLNSTGGSVAQARRLVQELEEDTVPTDGYARVTTVVKADATCLSACALVFMAGFDCAWGRRCQTSRLMQPFATIGFHSPYVALDVPEEASFAATARDLQNQYQAALDDLGYFVSLNANPYFVNSAIRYPSILVSELLQHSGPKDFYYIKSLRDTISLNIELYGRWKSPDGIDAEQIVLNACDNANWWNQIVKGFPSNEGPGRIDVIISGVRKGEVANYVEISAMPEGTGAMPVFQWGVCQIPFHKNQLSSYSTFMHSTGIYASGSTRNEIFSPGIGIEQIPLEDYIDSVDPQRTILRESLDFDAVWAILRPRVDERDLWLFWSMDSEISRIAAG